MNRTSRSNPRRISTHTKFIVVFLTGTFAILFIASLFFPPRIEDRLKEARINAAKAQIRWLDSGLRLFELDNGFFPSTEQGLEALITSPTTGKIPENNIKEGYLEEDKVPDDPWGNPYIYRSPTPSGFDYEIISLGADGLEGGEDENADIISWKIVQP